MSIYVDFHVLQTVPPQEAPRPLSTAVPSEREFRRRRGSMP